MFLPSDYSNNPTFMGLASQSAGDLVKLKLSQDSSLSGHEMQQLMKYIELLSESEKMDLAQIITTVSGAGIGLAVAKFLFKMGIKGSVVMSILGGLAGFNIGKSMTANPFTNNYSFNNSSSDLLNSFNSR